MKFVRFNGGRTGLVIERDGLQVLDVAGSLAALRHRDVPAATAIEAVLPNDGPASWTELIGRWEQVREAFQSLITHAADKEDGAFLLRPFEALNLEPPLASPTVHIFSFSSNTAVHIQRAFKAMKNVELTEADVLKPKNDGLPPGGFTLWPDTVIGPGATITPPRGTRLLDYEGECAVYVKSAGRNLKTVDIWGYAAWNDLGIRDTHLGLAKEAPWGPFSMNLPKNFDSGNACGPWVVVDEGYDIGRLRCVLTVNGEVRQDWNLRDMIYSFDEMLRYVSSTVSLRPGDMVTSGTGAGVAIEGGIHGPHWLKPGDVIEIRLEGAGTLTNLVGEW